MSCIEQRQKQIRISLIGGSMVGKTYLTHKLIGTEYNGYIPTTHRRKFSKKLQTKSQLFVYYDFPPINNEMSVQSTPNYHYDIFIFMFKDSDSFTQLYEFLSSITEKISQEQQPIIKQYWETVENIILVYSNFNQQGQVQTEQLFKILFEEIRNFNVKALIRDFVLKSQSDNFELLKAMIERNEFNISQDQILVGQQKQLVQDLIQSNDARVENQVSKQILANQNLIKAEPNSVSQLTKLVQIRSNEKKQRQEFYKQQVEPLIRLSQEQTQPQPDQPQPQGVGVAYELKHINFTQEQKIKRHNQILAIAKSSFRLSRDESAKNPFEEFRQSEKSELKPEKQLKDSSEKKLQEQENSSDQQQKGKVVSHNIKMMPKNPSNQLKKLPQSNYLEGEKPRKEKLTSSQGSPCFCM